MKFPAIFFFIGSAFLVGCAPGNHILKPMPARKMSKISDTFLRGLLARYPQYFDSLIKRNDQWQIKIIYTQIDRKKNNKPTFTNYFFNAGPGTYFYPASTVKMPTAALALQKLNELNIAMLDKSTSMITDAAYAGQTAVYNDPDSKDGRPNVEAYIKKIFLASDNNAFNRLYEFLGQEYINNTLHRMGYDSVQVIHRLNISLTEDQNRHTNPVIFYDSSLQILYKKPLMTSGLAYQKRNNFLGKGYFQGDKYISQPFDFSKKNRIALTDLHSILESIIFPRSTPRNQRFHLTEGDYRFLYRYMSMKPHESDYPQYDTSYTDAYSKLLLYGGRGDMDPYIRIFNKEGDAYGFLTDIAYVVDFKNNIEFFLSASILCNSDGNFNDDKYDYETVGYPFLKNLGRVIYEYEVQRKRKRSPDLSTFKMYYGR